MVQKSVLLAVAVAIQLVTYIRTCHGANETVPPTQSDAAQASICSQFRQSHYSTEFEAEQNACSKCEYNSDKKELSVECQYKYCTECNKDVGICAYRVVKLEHNFTDENDILDFVDGTTTITSYETEYCVDYTEGKDGFVCVSIGKYTSERCSNSDVGFGPPALTCTEDSGCTCYKDGDSISKDNPFVGFATIPFQSCYDPNVTVIRTLGLNSTSDSGSSTGSSTSTINYWHSTTVFLITLSIFASMQIL